MRSLIYTALAEDAALADNFHVGKVLVNNQFTEVPHDRKFLVIKYNNQVLRSRGFGRGPVEVQVWCHVPVELGRDYVNIENTLHEVKIIMFALADEADAEWRITDVRFNGLSGDLHDEGFGTLVKHASFEVLAHRVG